MFESGQSAKKYITHLLTCTDLRRSLSNESGVVFQCSGHRRSSAMLNPCDVDDLVCKDHPLEPQTILEQSLGMPLLAQFSLAPFSVARFWSAPLITANSQ